jgi:hypothetical protein
MIRTGFYTCTAARAFVHVYPAHPSLTGIGFQGTLGTCLYARRVRALPALKKAKVIWEICEGVLAHLNPGKGQILPTFMDKGAGQHTAKASLALLGIHN